MQHTCLSLSVVEVRQLQHGHASDCREDSAPRSVPEAETANLRSFKCFRTICSACFHVKERQWRCVLHACLTQLSACWGMLTGRCRAQSCTRWTGWYYTLANVLTGVCDPLKVQVWGHPCRAGFGTRLMKRASCRAEMTSGIAAQSHDHSCGKHAEFAPARVDRQ